MAITKDKKQSPIKNKGLVRELKVEIDRLQRKLVQCEAKKISLQSRVKSLEAQLKKFAGAGQDAPFDIQAQLERARERVMSRDVEKP